MKKIIILLLFSVFSLCSCIGAEYADLRKYRRQCAHNNEAACAKYLFVESWIDVREESFTTNLDKQDWYYWKDRYLDKLQTKEDAYVAIETMLLSLDDPYTRFLTPEEVEEQNMDIAAELSGIGVVIGNTDGKITIEDTIENSPAAKSGLKFGDIIVKIDGNSVSGYDLKRVAGLIRGKKGTAVELLILRNNQSITKKIVRDTIKIKSVTFKELDKDIAYIKLSTFMSQTASAEFAEALTKALKYKALVIDLRGNNGGLLQNAAYISNMLLKEGNIVSIHKKNNKTETIKVQHIGADFDKPIVVLTNGMSASAGEIFAAALQENGRASLVGEKTYGKGLIQRIVPLPLNTAMNVTIAKYLTPQGHDINKNGIQPDYEVKLTADDIKAGVDTQLNKAIEILKAEY
ncbi:MAG: S41 family peptidase [bacterium]|nr:S41 family peptidase [bacterium]